LTSQPFDAQLQREAGAYLQSVNDKRGSADTPQKVGQRKRRLREALYRISSVSTGNKEFTTDEISFRDAAISAIVESANIKDSVGQDLERYGSPPGGDLIDTDEYENETDDEEEEINGYVLKPKTATIFGTKDGFADWMRKVYLGSRPILAKMIKFNYWYKKDGTISWGKERSADGKRKAHKWVSYRLRQLISQNGIRPNSVTLGKSNTILNYDAGSHTLNKGTNG